MDSKTRKRFRRHVRKLLRQALGGDRDAVRSLCCIVLTTQDVKGR
jgi:hypothetical protein